LRFHPDVGSLSELLAPPYDVIAPDEARLLRKRHGANSVRLVLPEGSVPARYEVAARTLESWIDSGILELDSTPTVTVYRQTFSGPDAPITRHAVLAALQLSPFGEGEVLPHERTHSGPKRDRLALTLATRTQLSPVFLTTRDEEGDLYALLRGVSEGSEPDFQAETADGVAHAAWRVMDADTCERLCRVAGAGPLLVADGHHRYETAMEVRRQIGKDIPEARSVLVCVVSERDPGLRIQPTHRVLKGPPPGSETESWSDRLGEYFTLHPLPHPQSGPGRLAAEAERTGSSVLVTREGAWRLEPLPTAASDAGLDESDLAIASVVLDRLAIEAILGSDADEAAQAGKLVYVRDPSEAVSAAGSSGAAFLLPAVDHEAVWKVTGLGRRLPPKSTYYEPKIPSGLLFRPLYDPTA
jgi:uncharacterized protein (DUF1015 family)